MTSPSAPVGVRIDAVHQQATLSDAASRATEAERVGAAGLFVTEAAHDPFLPLTIAAEHTGTIDLGTSVAIAFARNPMSLAQQADDLHRFSGGRFVLGLGTQIRPHITRRFSMPWSRPADRMHEFVSAIRAIWRCWYQGEPLDFRGEFYTHTLMTPVFEPGPSPFAPPRVWIAAVGDRMAEVAGAVGDGIITHPLTTPRYLDEVLRPAVDRARTSRKAGPDGDRRPFEIAGMAMVATGIDEAALAVALEAVRMQIAFYGSTPAYRAILDLHEWGDLQPELNQLSKQGRWSDMTALVTDDLVGELAVVEPPDRVGVRLGERYGRGWDRVSLGLLSPLPEGAVADIIRDAAAAGVDGRG